MAAIPKPLHELNDDCLEKIFSYLSFRDIMNAELTCMAWKQFIKDKQMYRTLALKLCEKNLKEPLSEEYVTHVKEIRESLYQKKQDLKAKEGSKENNSNQEESGAGGNQGDEAKSS